MNVNSNLVFLAQISSRHFDFGGSKEETVPKKVRCFDDDMKVFVCSRKSKGLERL